MEHGGPRTYLVKSGFTYECGLKKSACTTCAKVYTCKHVPWIVTAISQAVQSLFIPDKKNARWKGLGQAHGKNRSELYVMPLGSKQLMFWGRGTEWTKQVISVFSDSERPISISRTRSGALSPWLTTVIQTISKQKVTD